MLHKTDGRLINDGLPVNLSSGAFMPGDREESRLLMSTSDCCRPLKRTFSSHVNSRGDPVVDRISDQFHSEVVLNGKHKACYVQF